MSRDSQIRFLSHTAPFYDAVVRSLGFAGLWDSVAACADPEEGTLCLDVCTGTAGVALRLAARGAEVVAVDLSPGMLGRAQRKCRARDASAAIHFAQVDARRLAFASRRFPIVTCCMALHEMADDERATVLSELQRVAADRVVVAEYRVPESRWGRALFRIGRAFEFLESDDFSSFLARPMAERLEEAGLKIEVVTNAGFYRVWSCRVAG